MAHIHQKQNYREKKTNKNELFVPSLCIENKTISSSGMMNEVEANDSDFNKKVFYEIASDTTVMLSDGKTLKFSKAMLCGQAKSEVFLSMFYGPLQNEIPKIEDIDHDTFKLFVDCVMGYASLNFEAAYRILHVAWKYQSGTMIEACLKALEPVQMDERVIDILNMAVLFDLKKLIDKILKFMNNDYNSYKLLDSKNYCELLSPESMKVILLQLKTIDSYILQIVINWAKNYLKENRKTCQNVKDFLKSIDLLKFFKIDNFETSSSLHDFLLLEKNFFSFDEVIHILKCPEKIIHKNSEWKKVQRNTVMEEQIIILSKCNSAEESVNRASFAILERNKLVCYENIKDGMTQILSCSVNLEFQNKSGQVINLEKIHQFDVLKSTQETYIHPMRCYDHHKSYGACQSHPSHQHYNGQSYKKNVRFRSHGLRRLEESMNFEFSLAANQIEDFNVCKLAFKISYTFLADCRILVTNRPGDNINNLMYYTADISQPFFSPHDDYA